MTWKCTGRHAQQPKESSHSCCDLYSFFGSVHASLHAVYNIYDTDMKRGGTWKEEVKGIGKGEEGGGIEGGGREKSSNCTLSLKGAKNFIPGKALFFLSLENSASTPLIAAAVHTHTATFTRPYVKTDAVFCRAQLDPPAHPAQPGVALRGPVPTANTAFPGAG